MPTGQSTYFDNEIYFNTYNPLRNYIGQCTWYAWSKAHVKDQAYPERGLNVSRIPTSNAKNWYSDAQNNGYSVGSVPKSDSIAVWGGNDGKYGHVVYVETWDGTNVCYSEANLYVNPNNGFIRVSDTYLSTVSSCVQAVTANLGINVPVYGGGFDGLFKTETRSNFEGRLSAKGFLGYIYLN